MNELVQEDPRTEDKLEALSSYEASVERIGKRRKRILEIAKLIIGKLDRTQQIDGAIRLAAIAVEFEEVLDTNQVSSITITNSEQAYVLARQVFINSAIDGLRSATRTINSLHHVLCQLDENYGNLFSDYAFLLQATNNHYIMALEGEAYFNDRIINQLMLLVVHNRYNKELEKETPNEALLTNLAWMKSSLA